MVIWAWILSASALGFDPSPPARVVDTEGSADVTWDAASLERVEVISTLYRWNDDPDAPTEVWIDSTPLLNLARGEAGFDVGRVSLAEGPVARVTALVRTDTSSDLFAEHLEVFYTEQVDGIARSHQHWRYFSVDAAGVVTELTPAAWNERVDPVEEVVDPEGRIERVQRGYSVASPDRGTEVGNDTQIHEQPVR